MDNNTAALIIGSQSRTDVSVKAAAEAVKTVFESAKEAGVEQNTIVAALNVLESAAKIEHFEISHCNFTMGSLEPKDETKPEPSSPDEDVPTEDTNIDNTEDDGDDEGEV